MVELRRLHNEAKCIDVHPSRYFHDVAGACVGIGAVSVLNSRNGLTTFRRMFNGQLPDMHEVDLRFREGSGKRLMNCLHILIDPHHFYHIFILRLVIL